MKTIKKFIRSIKRDLFILNLLNLQYKVKWISWDEKEAFITLRTNKRNSKNKFKKKL